MANLARMAHLYGVLNRGELDQQFPLMQDHWSENNFDQLDVSKLSITWNYCFLCISRSLILHFSVLLAHRIRQIILGCWLAEIVQSACTSPRTWIASHSAKSPAGCLDWIQILSFLEISWTAWSVCSRSLRPWADSMFKSSIVTIFEFRWCRNSFCDLRSFRTWIKILIFLSEGFTKFK